jgi:hypothetical protein
MKKIIVLIVIVLTLGFANIAVAGVLNDETKSAGSIKCEWFNNGSVYTCKSFDNILTSDKKAKGIITENEIISIFPNATKVNGVAVYLFNAKDIGVGAEYQIVRIENVANIDVQFASLSKGGSYVGPAVEVSFCDVMTKLGKTCSGSVATINPSLGMTVGYQTGSANTNKNWDYGIRVGLLNVDLTKVVTTVSSFLGF